MTLKFLFKKRQSIYYKELLKYMQYIFNDHFSLILFFLIGAGGYAYSNYLESIAIGSIQPRLFIVILYFVLVVSGSIALLVEEADQIFLLPKEEEFYPIFKGMLTKSYIQALIPIGFLSFITFPVFSVTLQTTWTEGVFIFVALASLKWLNLLVQIFPYFYQDEEEFQKYKLLIYIVTLLILAGLLFVNIQITTLFVLVPTLLSSYLFFTERIFFQHSLKWDTMISAEEARLQKVYRVIQLFTNVPHMETKFKRLSWLDTFLNKLSTRYPKAPYYYILRIVARNTDYSLLVLRLIGIGSVLLLLTDSYLFSILFTILFLYMLGFQLISLMNDIEKVPQFQVYPISTEEKLESVLRLIFEILIIMTVFFAVVSTIRLGLIGMILFPIGLLFSYIFSSLYVPYRVKAT